MNDSDIIQQATCSSSCDIRTPLSDEANEEDGSGDSGEIRKVSASDAIRAIDMLNSYFDTAGVSDFTTPLQKMKFSIEKDKLSALRQKTIFDCFTVSSK